MVEVCEERPQTLGKVWVGDNGVGSGEGGWEREERLVG